MQKLRAERRCESMLLNYKTTYRTDFHSPRTFTSSIRKNKEKYLSVPPAPPLSSKDIQILDARKSKNPHVPFNLYSRQEEINRIEPAVLLEDFEKQENKERERVRKTRPRIFITPAVSLDDAKEPDRQVLIDFTYSTEATKAMQTGLAMRLPTKNVKAPLSEVYAPCDVVKLRKLRVPYVSPEWRLDSISWDKRQLRI